jgi:hypothetical protein
MAEKDDVLRCPPARGQAEPRQSQVIARLTARNLRRKIDAHLAAISDQAEDYITAVATTGPNSDYLARQDDRWNPQLLIWRGTAR